MNHTSRFSDQDIFNAPGAMDEIHEKALKGRAVTHTVQFDVERNASAPPPRKVDCFRHPQKLPLAIFEFRYMSRGTFSSRPK